MKGLKHIFHIVNWAGLAPLLFYIAPSLGAPTWVVPIINGAIGHLINVAVPANISATAPMK